MSTYNASGDALRHNRNFMRNGQKQPVGRVCMQNQSIFSDAVMIAGVAGKSICITDIIASKKSDGTLDFKDGSTPMLRAYLKADNNGNSGFSHSFQNPWKLGEGNDFVIDLDDSNTDWSCSVGYYFAGE